MVERAGGYRPAAKHEEQLTCLRKSSELESAPGQAAEEKLAGRSCPGKAAREKATGKEATMKQPGISSPG